ncbi:MAG: hypothetical protein ACI83D_000469 [Planctomycetota bacterium]|jgi:hypothetical protein
MEILVHLLQFLAFVLVVLLGNTLFATQWIENALINTQEYTQTCFRDPVGIIFFLWIQTIIWFGHVCLLVGLVLLHKPSEDIVAIIVQPIWIIYIPAGTLLILYITGIFSRRVRENIYLGPLRKWGYLINYTSG